MTPQPLLWPGTAAPIRTMPSLHLPLTDHPDAGLLQGPQQPGGGDRLDESRAEKVTSILLDRALRLPSRSTAHALHRFASFGAANGCK